MSENKKPRLTEKELEICKALGAKWVSRDGFVSRDGGDRHCNVIILWKGELYLEKIDDYGSIIYSSNHPNIDCIAYIFPPEVHFPSVRPGDCISVEEAEDG